MREFAQAFEEITNMISAQRANWEEKLDYKFQTCMLDLFTINDSVYGASSIEGTYKSEFKKCKDNVLYLTELAMVMVIKTYEWTFEDMEVAKCYYTYWKKTLKYVKKNLSGDDWEYFKSIIRISFL